MTKDAFDNEPKQLAPSTASNSRKNKKRFWFVHSSTTEKTSWQ